MRIYTWGGLDCIENYVLTFADLNLGKGAKVTDKLLRMTGIVEAVYAPRVHKILARMGKSLPESRNILIDKERIRIKPFLARHKAPDDLRIIKTEDLVWSGDRALEVHSSSDLLTKDNQRHILSKLRSCRDEAWEDGQNCFYEDLLTTNQALMFKNIWYKVNDRYLRLVDRIQYFDKWVGSARVTIHFSKGYSQFREWKERVAECMERIFDIEDSTSQRNQLTAFCELFPPGERYATKMKAYLNN